MMKINLLKNSIQTKAIFRTLPPLLFQTPSTRKPTQNTILCTCQQKPNARVNAYVKI